MLNHLKKVIASTLVLTTLISTTTISAFASPSNVKGSIPDVKVADVQNSLIFQQPSKDTPQSGNTKIQPQGIKSFLVKEAVKVLASAFRHGGPALEYCLKWLDKSAAKSAKTYASSIASELDYIASIPDLVTNTVKEKIYYFLLHSLGLSGGTSLMIADAIATTINWLVL